MYKKIFLSALWIGVIGQLFLTQAVYAQNSLLNKVQKAITGKSISMTDSINTNLLKQIRSLESFRGKRINSIRIEQ